MDKGNDSTGTKKMSSFIEIFKNTKFIVVNVVALIVLGIAVFSGDGERIAQNVYENITGTEIEKFTPVDNTAHPSYIALKDKVFRDHNVKMDSVEVMQFKKSETSVKYRVILNDQTYFYTIEKSKDGVYVIHRLE